MAGQKTDERDVHLGQRMAESRKRSNLTQRRVAQSFGMSAAQLQKYEKGVNRVSAIHLDVLSRMTGVPLAEFFEGMPRLDGGFEEPAQTPLEAEGPWAHLAVVLARHVGDHFSEASRRDLATVVDTLKRELTRQATSAVVNRSI